MKETKIAKENIENKKFVEGWIWGCIAGLFIGFILGVILSK